MVTEKEKKELAELRAERSRLETAVVPSPKSRLRLLSGIRKKIFDIHCPPLRQA